MHRVVDLTLQGNALEREICLVKVKGEGEHRGEALRLAAAFGAKTLDATLNSFVFELTGATEEIDRFMRLMTRDRPGRDLPDRHRRDGARGRAAVGLAPSPALGCAVPAGGGAMEAKVER